MTDDRRGSIAIVTGVDTNRRARSQAVRVDVRRRGAFWTVVVLGAALAVLAMHAITATHGPHLVSSASAPATSALHADHARSTSTDHGSSTTDGHSSGHDLAATACAFIILAAVASGAVAVSTRPRVAAPRGVVTQSCWAPDPPVPRFV